MRIKFVFLCLFYSLAFSVQDGSCATMRDSVVKVFANINQVDFSRPWQSRGSRSITGSGCVISNHRILTNAHVVSDATFIQVRKESSPRKFTAHIEAIGHDCDLAILRVDDEEFFKEIVPLEFSDLPQLQDAVTVLGFPTGGDKLSITEGVVSRIEIIPYAESAKKLLAVQIDAAINPGNSGGPVLKDNKLVGIAMQLMTNSQNIGYMIPVPIINHFIDDLADSTYDGFPTLGIDYSLSENPALRKYLGIEDEEGGVIVTHVLPYSSAYKKLHDGDVILEVDQIPVSVDGTFEFRPKERLGFSHLINRRQCQDSLKFRIVRNKKEKMLDVTLSHFVGLIPYPNYFKKPPYYIYGGLVFTVLSADLIRSYGGEWWKNAPIDYLYLLFGEGQLNLDEKQEVVVLLEVLPDALNIGYHGLKNQVIKKVDGREFSSFKEFIEIIAKNKEKQIIFETISKENVVISTNEIEKKNIEILERNNIPRAFSALIAELLAN